MIVCPSPAPSIVSWPEVLRGPVVSVMTIGGSAIVSASVVPFACRTAARSEPVPVSALVVTSIVAAVAGAANDANTKASGTVK
jgi:hypothetical protein